MGSRSGKVSHHSATSEGAGQEGGVRQKRAIGRRAIDTAQHPRESNRIVIDNDIKAAFTGIKNQSQRLRLQQHLALIFSYSEDIDD